MPTLSELVDAEATAAEAEFPDEDEHPNPDDEPTEDELGDEGADQGDGESEAHAVAPGLTDAAPTDLPPIGPEEIAKAEKARDAQRRKLAGILGDGYVAHDCPMCSALGFLPELPPVGVVLEVVPDGDTVGFNVQAPEPQPDYVQAPDKEACPWCEALGFVVTGSRNPNAAVAPCTKCSGNGWVTKAVEVAPVSPVLAPQQYPTTTGGPAPDGLGLDAWGRPAGHQHWGVPPASIPG